MVFSSVLFLFWFLPVVILLYFVASKGMRNVLLLAASLLFYSWGEPQNIFIMIASIIVNYVFSLWIYSGARTKKLALIGAISFNLLLLIGFKYTGFILSSINSALTLIHAHTLPVKVLALPLGISFYTFHSISYIVDIYRRISKPAKNPVDMGLYIAFFPQLIAGPIIRFHDIADQIQNRSVSLEKFSEGAVRFIIGLSKKVIIANPLGLLADKIFQYPPSELSTGFAWLAVISYSLQLFFDFAGYSDMAIGLAKMFGFEFLENFNYPYISTSIKDFWQRWHISLSRWFKDYLYIPLGGNRISPQRTYINLLIVFFVTGLWHGANFTFVLWGLFHGFFLILERTRFGNVLSKMWLPARHIYTLLIVICGWAIFRSSSITAAFDLLKSMAGISGGHNRKMFIEFFMNTDQVLALVAGVIFSIPVVSKLSNFLNRYKSTFSAEKKQIFENTQTVLVILSLSSIFIFSGAKIASGTYNPFIYFRF